MQQVDTFIQGADLFVNKLKITMKSGQKIKGETKGINIKNNLGEPSKITIPIETVDGSIETVDFDEVLEIWRKTEDGIDLVYADDHTLSVTISSVK